MVIDQNQEGAAPAVDRLPTWRDVTDRFNRRHRTRFNVKTVQMWERNARRKMIRMLRDDPQIRGLLEAPPPHRLLQSNLT